MRGTSFVADEAPAERWKFKNSSENTVVYRENSLISVKMSTFTQSYKNLSGKPLAQER